MAALAETRRQMNNAGIEVSLFIAPDAAQIGRPRERAPSLSSCTQARLRRASISGREAELARLVAAAKQAHELGPKVKPDTA